MFLELSLEAEIATRPQRSLPKATAPGVRSHVRVRDRVRGWDRCLAGAPLKCFIPVL